MTKAFLLAATMMLGAGFPAMAEPASTPPGDPGCLPRASDGFPEPSAEDARKAGARVMREIYGDAIVAQAKGSASTTPVTPDIGNISMNNIMGGLWARCGLARRDRSLVNLGILITMRANNQLREHFLVAFHNGLTQRELEEVIYQAAGYAGFPAAANAREVLLDVVKERDGKQ